MVNPAQEIVLVGGGGHCRSVIDVIEAGGLLSVAAVVDIEERVGGDVSGYPICGTDADLEDLIERHGNGLVTVGQIGRSATRVALYRRLLDVGADLPVVVSPRATVSPRAAIGPGSVVMHGAVVNSGAVVGVNSILNSQSLVEHDAVVGDHCHISTAAVVNGGAVVGERVFVGSGAVIYHGVRVGDGAVVAAGAIVSRDVAPGEVTRGRREL